MGMIRHGCSRGIAINPSLFLCLYVPCFFIHLVAVSVMRGEIEAVLLHVSYTARYYCPAVQDAEICQLQPIETRKA